jgi:hypothetical protein
MKKSWSFLEPRYAQGTENGRRQGMADRQGPGYTRSSSTTRLIGAENGKVRLQA